MGRSVKAPRKTPEKNKVTSAPNATSALDRLAELIGIESKFKDARGIVQRTSVETKCALLAAMGVRAGNEREAEKSLQEIEQAEWSRVLAPVYVVHSESREIRVAVNLPARTGEIRWRLRLEDGSEKSGQAVAKELRLIAKREVGGRKLERRSLSFGADGKSAPEGYHRLRIEFGTDGAAGTETMLIVTPKKCWLPESVARGEKIWGVAAQVYTLKSKENWGIGDFGDLRRLASVAEAEGADIVGVNPLHALFPDNPEHASPYSPSSRLLLNILYIDVTAVPGFDKCPAAQKIVHSDEFQRELSECREAPMVDYTRVTELKLPVLRLLFEHEMAAKHPSVAEFEKFRGERGETLERSSAFYCLRQKFVRDGASGDWRNWPKEYCNPESKAVKRFRDENKQEVSFAAWLQWLADRQLERASDEASGMQIGLYRDLAVGADPSGTETWFNQKAVVSEAHIGAPPDVFNPAGQDWGLPPFHPRELREQAYAGFIELIRANMRYAGALRVDHVMALQHLYLIPAGMGAHHGAYVRYPMEDLIGILALESQRNQCMVVGEDLGTVPDGFRERMQQANILSYRVLFFEQESKTGVYRKPKDYPQLAVAVASNHDLPTVPAWWMSLDIELRDRLKLYPDGKEVTFQAKLRQRDETQLRRAMEKQGLLEKADKPGNKDWVPLVYQYLARSESFAALIQLDDVTGEVDPVNLPGSTYQYPNWRRKLSVELEELFETAPAQELVEIFDRERGANRGELEKAIEGAMD